MYLLCDKSGTRHHYLICLSKCDKAFRCTTLKAYLADSYQEKKVGVQHGFAEFKNLNSNTEA